ncbi:MAG: DUF262 domain-containing protein [Thiotrichales bacterium]
MKQYFKERSIEVVKLVDWLELAANHDPDYSVVLPMIQRGFVWKPSQIIELWDSLLHGMPTRNSRLHPAH